MFSFPILQRIVIAIFSFDELASVCVDSCRPYLARFAAITLHSTDGA